MLTQTPLHAARNQIGLLKSARVQLALTLTLAILPPTIFLFGFNYGAIFQILTARVSIAAAFIAIVLATLALRRMQAFPGVTAAGFIVPAFASTFGLVALVVLVFRVPYSAQLLTSAFALAISARFAIESLVQRSAPPRYLIVPGGRVNRVLDALGGQFVQLTAPQLAVDPHAVIVADLHHDHSDEWERLFADASLKGIAVFHYKQVWEAVSGRVWIEHLSENGFGSLLPNLTYRKLKRLTDFGLSIIMLPFMIPVMLITACVVKWDSPGPVLFRQTRVGYRGHPFRVIKFRTMRHEKVNADTVDGTMTRDDDLRITRVGHFLRRTRIDELPQILNILRGEMSWIGPRPEALPLAKLYESELPFYSYRHIVRPGITGWAQVNQGHVTSVGDVNNKLQFDFFYIKNFSYWIDTLILLRTVMVVLTGFGSK